MPFTMTHLIIADNISNLFEKNIQNLPQFFLGSVAPDAVHNRANYVSDFKKDSHLCVGAEKWGNKQLQKNYRCKCAVNSI